MSVEEKIQEIRELLVDGKEVAIRFADIENWGFGLVSGVDDEGNIRLGSGKTIMRDQTTSIDICSLSDLVDNAESLRGQMNFTLSRLLEETRHRH